VTDDVLFSRRPRDLAITDVRFAMRPDGILTDRRGYRYLVYGRGPRATPYGAPIQGEVVAEPARRFTDWVLSLTCGGCYLAAIWYFFFVV
jgi:hypothetical protein